MTTTLYTGEYSEVVYDASLSLISVTWFPATEKMTEEEFKDEAMIAANFVAEKQPRFTLFNSSQLYFTISLDLQQWTGEKLVPIYKGARLEKMAIIIPQEFIAQLAIEQTVDEAQEEGAVELYDIEYMDNEDTAIDWFKEVPA